MARRTKGAQEFARKIRKEWADERRKKTREYRRRKFQEVLAKERFGFLVEMYDFYQGLPQKAKELAGLNYINLSHDLFRRSPQEILDELTGKAASTTENNDEPA